MIQSSFLCIYNFKDRNVSLTQIIKACSIMTLQIQNEETFPNLILLLLLLEEKQQWNTEFSPRPSLKWIVEVKKCNYMHLSKTPEVLLCASRQVVLHVRYSFFSSFPSFQDGRVVRRLLLIQHLLGGAQNKTDTGIRGHPGAEWKS